MVPRKRKRCVGLSIEGPPLIHLGSHQPPFFHYLSPASSRFQDCSPDVSDILVALLSSGEDARKQGTASLTQDENTCSWSRCLQFLDSLEFKDEPYLVTIPKPWQHTTLLSAFALAISLNPTSLHQLSLPWLKENPEPPLTTWLRPSGMVSDQIPASMTMENRRYFFCSNTAAIATSTKTPSNRKRSCSSSFFQLIKTRSSIENIAIAQLCTGAFFFAMRSCNHLCTNIAEEKRQTKTLRIRKLRFFKKGSQLVHSDRNLYLANTITLILELQKSDKRHEPVTMHRSGDSTLCPVQAWAAIVNRILGYPGTNSDTTVNTISLAGKLKTINSSTCKAS